MQCLARSKSHRILLQETGELQPEEITYLSNGWLVHRNPAGDLAVLACNNFCQSYIAQIAGSAVVHKFLPMSYMICEVCFGKGASREQIEAAARSRNLRDYDRNNMEG